MPARAPPKSSTDELRPVITTGAEVMDQIFQPKQQRAAHCVAAWPDFR
jgi:hypothetical protein